MQEHEVIPHLFRIEFSKIVAVLSKSFGIAHIEIAEDIASETFLSALSIWTYKGLPPNPTAWLYTVAKNKAKNHLHRHDIFREKVVPGLVQNQPAFTEDHIDLSEKNIADSQLSMLFAICHPSIAKEAQIGLVLRILCGFGIDEIATAFLSNKETINKRLFRAKEKLRQENISLELPSADAIAERLDTVLTCIYLLFNEGYYSETNDDIIREDLCAEAMRLADMFLQNEMTALPKVYALQALMCFHSSRLKARKGNHFVAYEHQDENLWNQELIAKGIWLMKQAATGNQFSRYHLEAGIAYWHTIKNDSLGKWENILHLYNLLLQLEYSPVAALNRMYAFSKVHGKQKAIVETEKLKLEDNHYYFMLLADLYTGFDDGKARHFLEEAFRLAKSVPEKEAIGEKIEVFERHA
jgi:RNA polymerase sigma factor (sigma-70 family)